ncbi:MAG TPA: hypothetical protein PKH07_14180, partial [bacterium]|nr:hypothetical protein [bacterium]
MVLYPCLKLWTSVLFALCLLIAMAETSCAEARVAALFRSGFPDEDVALARSLKKRLDGEG